MTSRQSPVAYYTERQLDSRQSRQLYYVTTTINCIFITITSDRFASPNAPGLPAAPSKPKLPHSGGHTAEIRSEIAPEMAENSNNSNDNGGSDDAILAMLEGNITKATLKAACYAFSDKIKAEKKAIYSDKIRALVVKKSHNDADAYVREKFPAGPYKYSFPSVEEGKAHLMAMTTEEGAPYWNPPLLESQICVTSCAVLKKACASFKSPTPAAVSMAAAPTASPPPPKTEGKISKKKADIAPRVAARPQTHRQTLRAAETRRCARRRPSASARPVSSAAGVRAPRTPLLLNGRGTVNRTWY